MRLTRTGWGVLGTVVIAGLLLSWMYLSRETREQKLADGSILRIEKVYFGKPENFEFKGWLEQLKAKLPNYLAKHFVKPPKAAAGTSRWYSWATAHTNEDALYVYITRRNSLTGALQSVDLPLARLLDEHGCVFMATQAGGYDNGQLALNTAARSGMGGGSSVNWFRFEAFPRHARKFRIQFSGRMQTNLSQEITLHNPAPQLPRKKWVGEPLPITRVEERVSFILSEVKLRTNSVFTYQSGFQPALHLEKTIDVIEDGQPSTNWTALETELYDSSGNFAGSPWGPGPILCPQEEAWKLRVKFFASEQSHGASNTTWALRGIAVPAPGEHTNLNLSQVLNGVTVKAMEFTGQGDYSYSNSGEKFLSGAPLKEPLKETSMDYKNSERIVHGKTPHLNFSIAYLDDDQRFTVRAVDDQGREFYGLEWPQWNSFYLNQQKTNKVHYLQKSLGSTRNVITVLFDLPPDSKTVDLFFCVHNCRTPEFIFKPPAL